MSFGCQPARIAVALQFEYVEADLTVTALRSGELSMGTIKLCSEHFRTHILIRL